MADENSNQGASTSVGTSSESTVHVNVKTLDSQIYTFDVEKDMPVSLFKEKIADTIGVPVGQQRLIFRGKILKDEHCLSEYYVEDGHTLHLVARQPAQPQTSAGTNPSEANGNNDNQGTGAGAGAGAGAGGGAGAPRNRVGQVSHSVVLGTFNIGEQGEGIVPDLTRIIGAVLNSVGVGNQVPLGGATNISATIPSNASNQAPQGVETEAARGNIGGRGGQPFPSHPFQSFSPSLQFPFTGAAVTLPSHQMPIPDSLSTISEFINHMELALSVNGSQSSSPVNVGDPPRVSLPSDARGLPNVEALSIVMRQAHQLLSAHAVAALSHIAGRLEGELDATDPAARNQIQTEAVQVGQAMQHLGALFLELGRTILTLRMGQSPAESLVNAGPAVYISPSGPNPIMVQPFPLQTSSLFGGPAAAGGGGGNGAPPNPSIMVPVGLGDSPRNVNIHIHAGTSLAGVGPRANNGEVTRGEHRNGTNSGDSGPPRVLPVRNIIATAVPSRFTADGGHSRNVFHPSHIRTQQNNPGATSTAQGSGVATSGISQSTVGASVPQPPPDSASIPTLVAQINAQIRNLVDDMQGENRAPSGQSAGSTLGSDRGEDSVNHQQVSLPAHGADETSGLVPDCVPEGEGQQQPLSHQYKNDEEPCGSFSVKEASSADTAGGSSYTNEETIKSEVASESAPTSDDGHVHTQEAKAVPLGLGLGGLHPRMRRGRQGRSQGKNGAGTSSSSPVNLNQQSITHGQQVLQSLISRGSNTTRRESIDSSSGELAPLLRQTMDTNHSMPMPAVPSNGQFDAAGMMSQVLNSPALNNLLAGVSEQAGIGSPDGLRNMFEQFTRSPSMRNTLNQITEQLDVQDIGNMFSGMGSGQGGGGGMDFSRMIQQMMPIVTQSLTRSSAANPESSRVLEPRPQQHTNESRTVRDAPEDLQIDLQEVADRIERHDPPADIFRPVVENAAHLYAGASSEELIEELCSDEDLANEFVEMLRRDIRRKLQGGSHSDVDSLL